MNKNEPQNTSKLFTLFLTFLKIGAFTFGGGYAMVPLLENEFIAKKKWIENDEFIDMIAISESTPGPVAINSATYIGYKTGGFAGALVSTIAVSLPSFAVIYIISLFLDRFLTLTVISHAFGGIQACVIYLILTAGIRLLKGLEKNAFNITVIVTVSSVMTVLSLLAVDFSSIYYILICGVSGVAVYYIKRFIKQKGGSHDIS